MQRPSTPTETKLLRRDMEIQAKFLEFHQENPDVLEMLLDLARQLRRKGFQSASIYMLFERARWQLVEQYGPDHNGIALNNNYRPYYARLIMERYPEEFAGFFRVRKLRAKGSR